MVLNKGSYVHLKIRALCLKLEQISGIKLQTNLSKEFEQLEFKSNLSYVIIDYKNYAVFTLSHKISYVEQDLINDIMIYLNWLETGHSYTNRKRRGGTKNGVL